MQDGREGLEDDALFGVLKAVALGLILVLAVEGLDLDIILERIVEVLNPLDVQLQICPRAAFSTASQVIHEKRTVELLDPAALVVDVDALDLALHLADEQRGNRALGLGTLHLALELIKQHTTKLLHIMLQKAIQTRPAERLCQLGGPDRLIARLEMIEHSLQGKSDALGRVLFFSRDLVHSLSLMTTRVSGVGACADDKPGRRYAPCGSIAWNRASGGAS